MAKEDKELKAMAGIARLLDGLESGEVSRILRWTAARFKVEDLHLGGEGQGEGQGGNTQKTKAGTLAAFLKTANNTDSQVGKFLATAEWLHLKGKASLKTSDVTGALESNRQNKLSNAAERLNQNIKKGFCEKTGKEFYVTDDGRRELGVNDG